MLRFLGILTGTLGFFAVASHYYAGTRPEPTRPITDSPQWSQAMKTLDQVKREAADGKVTSENKGAFKVNFCNTQSDKELCEKVIDYHFGDAKKKDLKETVAYRIALQNPQDEHHH